MLINARNMLRLGGRLVLEVPLATRRPFAVPHNPHHLREYTRAEIEDLVRGAGFTLAGARGMSRGIYTTPELAREAIQLHAVKPDGVLWVHEPAERMLQERASAVRRRAARLPLFRGRPGAAHRLGAGAHRPEPLRPLEGARLSGLVRGPPPA